MSTLSYIAVTMWLAAITAELSLPFVQLLILDGWV